MQLEHSFSVPVGIDDAWKILLDIERIGPCMPGATIESVDGDDFTGSVKVKLGPINLTYKGKASFVEKDADAHKAVIDARGRDARGNGTASAKVTATLAESGGETTVKVLTDLDITGKPAQFGRGVMVDVGNKLIGQFADCLSDTISGGGAAAAAPAKKAAAKAPAKAAAKTSTDDAGAKAPAGKAGTPADAAVDDVADAPAKAPAKAARPRPGGATGGSLSGGGGAAAAAADAPISGSAPQAAAESEPVAGTAPDSDDAPSFAAPTEVPAASEPDDEPSVNGHASSAPRTPPREAEPIDLLASAGPAVAKRIVPIVAPVAVAAVVVLLARRRRR